jgi:hypothetical protein
VKKSREGVRNLGVSEDNPLRLPCRTLEWSVPRVPRSVPFKVRFISPVGEEPWRYYVEPIVADWRGRESRFLEQA